MFAKRPFLFAKSAIFGKHVCNSIRFFYAFLNIMGYVCGRIPDQRSYKRKNSVPSKKLDFTLFFASVKGFEPPAFRLGGERSILLSYTDLFTFLGFFIHLINRQKSRGDCSNSALGGGRSILLSYRNTHVVFVPTGTGWLPQTLQRLLYAEGCQISIAFLIQNTHSPAARRSP